MEVEEAALKNPLFPPCQLITPLSWKLKVKPCTWHLGNKGKGTSHVCPHDDNFYSLTSCSCYIFQWLSWASRTNMFCHYDPLYLPSPWISNISAGTIYPATFSGCTFTKSCKLQQVWFRREPLKLHKTKVFHGCQRSRGQDAMRGCTGARSSPKFLVIFSWTPPPRPSSSLMRL